MLRSIKIKYLLFSLLFHLVLSFFSPPPVFSRRVKEINPNISTYANYYYGKLATRLGIPPTEENIRQLWNLAQLARKHGDDPAFVEELLLTTAGEGLLNQENFPQVIKLYQIIYNTGNRPISLVSSDFQQLEEREILTPETLPQIIELLIAGYKVGEVPHLPSLKSSLIRLQETGILNPDTFPQLIRIGITSYQTGHAPDSLYGITLPFLKEKGVLETFSLEQITELTQTTLRMKIPADTLLHILGELYEGGILTRGNIQQIWDQLIELYFRCAKEEVEMDSLFPLVELSEAKIINENNLLNIGEIFISLHKQSKLTGVYLWDLERAFDALIESGIINQRNLSLIGNKLIELAAATIKSGFRISITALGVPDLIKSGVIDESLLLQVLNIAIEVVERDKIEVTSWIKELAKFTTPREIETALKLFEAGFIPAPELVLPILSEEPVQVDEYIRKYKTLEEELYSRTPHLNDPTEVAIYYPILVKKDRAFAGIEFQRYKEMLSNVREFLSNYPEFSNPFGLKDYQFHSIRGEHLVYSEALSERVNDKITHIRRRYQDLVELNLSEIGDNINLLDFVKRVYAYLIIKHSPSPPSIIKGETLTSFIKKGFRSQWVDEETQTLFTNYSDLQTFKRSIRRKLEEGKFTPQDIIEAIFAVSFYNYNHIQVQTSPQKRRIYERLMSEAIISLSLEEPEISGALNSENLWRKIQALIRIFHQDNIYLMLNKINAKGDVPQRVKEIIANEQRQIYSWDEETQSVENGTVYTLIPAKFDAIFRGYTFLDCTQKDDYGYPYIWTVHPNNMYYFLLENNTIIGYIGLSETNIKGDKSKKVLLVDVLQFHAGEKLVENILRVLGEEARENGFLGIALPIELNNIFESERTKTAIKSLKCFQYGEIVNLEYIDTEATKVLQSFCGEDIYHSLFYSEAFMLLNFNLIP